MSLKKFNEFLDEAFRDYGRGAKDPVHRVPHTGEITSDVHKYVKKIMNRKELGGHFTNGMTGSVEHHPDGSSTLHVHHSSGKHFNAYGQEVDSSHDRAVSMIDHLRERHRNEFNHRPEKVLNGKTKSEKDGYAADPKSPHMDIHTETTSKGAFHHTKIHFKPSKG